MLSISGRGVRVLSISGRGVRVLRLGSTCSVIGHKFIREFELEVIKKGCQFYNNLFYTSNSSTKI